MHSFDNLINFFRKKIYDDMDLALGKPELVKYMHLYAFKSEKNGEVLNSLNINLNSYKGKFIKLNQLQELFIHGIHQPFLPEEIGNIMTLKKIGILNIWFEYFPEWITNLLNLEYLRIRGAHFNTIPNCISKLQNLKVLSIENGSLSLMPELNQLKKLKYLSFADGILEKFPLEKFPPNLKILNLGGPIYRYDKKEIENLHKAFPNLCINSIYSPRMTFYQRYLFDKNFYF